ncbi:MAG: hypothetical protein NXI12_07535 [Alphaproteobacteria bacterium]|nr:hypothetical protein [Alphaproteobacteria bacterium]
MSQLADFILAAAAVSAPAHAITWFDGEPSAEHRMLLVGEIHGIQSNYAVLEALVLQAAAEGDEVVLALELPVEGQEAIDQLWRGAIPRFTPALISATGWCALDDGRASVEMLSMMERLKHSEHASAIKVTAFDTRSINAPAFETIAGISNFSSAALAVSLARLYERHAGATIIASVGNHHASLAVDDFEAVHGGGEALQAAQLLSGITNAVAITYQAGERFGCGLEGCGRETMWNSGASPSAYQGYVATGPSVAVTPLSQSDYCAGDQGERTPR